MKRLSLLILALFLFVLGSFAQAKKPVLMIVPMEKWMIANRYYNTQADQNGASKQVPDYEMAFSKDADLSKFIQTMQSFMQEQKYEVRDLETALADSKQQDAITDMDKDADAQMDPLDAVLNSVPCDIIVKLNYEIKRSGPEKFVEIEVGAYDAYNQKPVSVGHLGSGTPAAGSIQWTNQIKESVSNFKDKFISDMDNYFQGLFTKGRQIKLICNRASEASVSYSKLYDDEPLSTLMEDFLVDNALNGNASKDGPTTKNKVTFTAQIPMTITTKQGKVKAATAEWLANKLASFMRETTNQPCRVLLLGLGSARITLGASDEE